ncbi:MAG: chromosome partitioning protein ParB [Flavobacteriales bacterium]|nr:chromosome partitioning protein ParB [Flavobacteriales bacterium]
MMKANKKTRLGRGISAIFNSSSKFNTVENTLIQNININSIKLNPYQPRTYINNKEIQELSDSILTYGLIQPITVRKVNHSEYELISGERRLTASKLAGLSQIPVFIKNIEDNQMLEVALVENIQRQDLDPIEIALSLKQLISEYNIKHDTLGKKIGKSRSTISNYIRLLKLDPIIQAGVRDKIISMGHAKAILNILDQKLQLKLYQEIIKNKYSVRETEQIVKTRKIKENRIPVQSKIILSNQFQKIEKELAVFFNQKVNLKISKNGNGKIEIPFQSEKKIR